MAKKILTSLKGTKLFGSISSAAADKPSASNSYLHIHEIEQGIQKRFTVPVEALAEMLNAGKSSAGSGTLADRDAAEQNITLFNVIGSGVDDGLYTRSSSGEWEQVNRSIERDVAAIMSGAYFEGLKLTVPALRLNDWAAEEQTITLHTDGVWYVGFDLFSRELIALPRLGHRGWVPVGRYETVSGVVTEKKSIEPVMPTCRIPRTVSKITSGKPANVVVLGSSLAEGFYLTKWTGMLFKASAEVSDYKVPGVGTFRNLAIGGMPNQYTLSQLGVAAKHSGRQWNETGFSDLLNTSPDLPRGRASALQDVDLIIVTLLANGLEQRLECIEPIIREARKTGAEVLVVSDNPQGAPFAGYDSVTSAMLYKDGPRVLEVVEKYKVEFADTAAYVAASLLQYPSASIYADSIHMTAAAPTGRTGEPGSGHEVWCRAIRSTIPVGLREAAPVLYNFGSGLQSWYVYGPTRAAISTSGGALVCEKNTAITGYWGARVNIPAVASGDTIAITGTRTTSGDLAGVASEIGIQALGSGWKSPTVFTPSANGTFDITITASEDVLSGGYILVNANKNDAAIGASLSLDNVSITVNSSVSGAALRLREQLDEHQSLPASRKVTDNFSPGMVHLTLPRDEKYVRDGRPEAGTLVASAYDEDTFTRQLFPHLTEPLEEVLQLAVDDVAGISADGAVGFSIIVEADSIASNVVVEVFLNNASKGTKTISQALNRGQYFPLLAPSEVGRDESRPTNMSCTFKVVSGLLNVSALIALTPEMEYVNHAALEYSSDWAGPQLSDGQAGMSTVVAGAFAMYRHQYIYDTVWWALSSNTNGGTSEFSGDTTLDQQSVAGGNHMRVYGGHKGRLHTLKNLTDLGFAGNPADGYSAHIAGLIIVKDR